MEEKVLNEAQMRKYIENEVRNALLSESINENITDEGLLDLLKNVFGIGTDENGQNTQNNENRGISLEGIIGAILGHIAIAPLLTKILNAIGIPANGPLGQFILKRVSEIGGYSIGQWVDRNMGDPIGLDNLFGARTN